MPPLILAALMLPQNFILLAPMPQYDFTSTTSVAAYVEHQAILHGVSTSTALYVSGHESHHNIKARGDMDITCKNPRSPYYGEPVGARGEWQITKCYHPEVTDEQADDLVWSTAWAMERLGDKKTCRQEWSTCKKLFPL